MKNAIILFVCIITIDCVAQSKTKAWLPEKFIEGINRGDTTAYKYLSPISGLMMNDKGLLMLSGYGGETNPVKNRKIEIQGKEKYQLFHVEQHINMKYETRKLVDSLTNATIYVSFSGKKALLEIIWQKRICEIYFVDHDDEYMFKDIRESFIHLANKNQARRESRQNDNQK